MAYAYVFTSQKNSVSNGSVIAQRKPNVNACVSWSSQLVLFGSRKGSKKKRERKDSLVNLAYES